MARPNNLNNKTNFNVHPYGKEYGLFYKNKLITTGERSRLYRERKQFIQWMERFKRLNIVSID